jgi:hypothetical protein
MGEISPLEKIRLGLTASLWTDEQADALAQELYDAVAHELAEQVREAEPYVPEGFSLRPEWLDVWSSAKAELADKIDPEVEQ